MDDVRGASTARAGGAADQLRGGRVLLLPVPLAVVPGWAQRVARWAAA
ncbi:hypothetical protein QH494_16055 [Sphingomonas sp. AR_OL41]|nr:hypothetical protein [Sphingomonas sp. AR_OL41]MDH7973706.1 hypothetical protein [Sphingomonas sp. AR_OL41]